MLIRRKKFQQDICQYYSAVPVTYLAQVYAHCFVDTAFGMYFTKSLKPEISVLYPTCYALSAHTDTNKHTEC